MSPNAKTGDSFNRQYDLIGSILASNMKGVTAALTEEPMSVQDVHHPTGMSAPMLACNGRQLKILAEILEHASLIDFYHKDEKGRDLLDVAFDSLHPEILSLITELYEKHVPEIVNNWPSPET